MIKLTDVLTKLHSKPPKTLKASTPVYVNNKDGSVQISHENRTINLRKTEVDSAFHLSLTGKDFVLKMMSLVFSSEELAASNFSGGRTVCGAVTKHKNSLKNNWKFKAILSSAESNFPGCTDGHFFKILKDAVNNKCRKLDSKLKQVQQQAGK